MGGEGSVASGPQEVQGRGNRCGGKIKNSILGTLRLEMLIR